ncbi:MAG: deoxyhypusine synthase [Acidobacteria bacterium]|nr:deoxyhypusine synthase [Acidobacteriota bacterium]
MKHHAKGKIEIRPLQPRAGVADLIDDHFNAYNAARVQEICHLMHLKVMKPRVTVGLSLSGALIPAGLGSILIPLIEKGFIDYIVSTGANLYHDLHFGLGFDLWRSTPFLDDVELHRKRLIRIYDIIFDLDVLLKSDSFLFKLVGAPEFQKKMATSELHHLIGRYVDAMERKTRRRGTTLLGAAYRCGVPIYTSSPGDSTIGMNLAARTLTGNRLEIDVALDVNESAAMVYEAKRRGESAVMILGGGSPKNFLLQTEPQLQEVLGLDVTGHDYFVQITDARPDTGGLSGATPGEAVSWGKINPDTLPDCVVCYADSTIAFPLVAAYVLTRCRTRPLKRLYDRREKLLARMTADFLRARGKGKRSARGTIGTEARASSSGRPSPSSRRHRPGAH